MWFDEAVFYQIYPLGFCGAEKANDFGEIRHRFHKIEAKIPRMQPRWQTKPLPAQFGDMVFSSSSSFLFSISLYHRNHDMSSHFSNISGLIIPRVAR